MAIRPLTRSSVILVACLAACASESHEECQGNTCEVGACDSPTRGRDPVVMADGTMAYAGQAVMLRVCATGCHSSAASGTQRLGAPVDANFDLYPVRIGDGATSRELDGLRDRQADIFARRNELWSMVQRGKMPLAGAGDTLRTAAIGEHVTLEGADCTVGEALAPFDDDETRTILREWLACGAPFIEAQGDLPAPVAGTHGDRFPECPPGGDVEPTFDNVYERIIAVNCAISGCHAAPINAPIDLGSAQAAYESLLGAGSRPRPDCVETQFPYVTPEDPARSYLMAKLGVTGEPVCGSTMPPSGMLDRNLLELIERWIRAGAPAPAP